jgi:hypothetical protein
MMRPSDHDPPGHPEELLAVFVDGSASVAEREEVERHVGGCATCREALDLAAAAALAARALPELDSPGVRIRALVPGARPTETGRAGGPVADRAPVGRVAVPHRPRSPSDSGWRGSARSGSRLQRLAWGAGLAAAAVIAVVFFVSIGQDLGGRDEADVTDSAQETAGSGGTGQAPADAAREVPVLRGTIDQTPESLAALAQGLAGGRSAFAEGQAGPSPSPSLSAVLSAAAAPTEVLSCIESATGSTVGLEPVYLEDGTFEGRPAYIGAFLEPAEDGSSDPEALLVFAVTRSDCEILYVVRQPI